MCDPFNRRACRDVDSDQVSTVQPNDDEGIEQTESMVGTTRCPARDYAGKCAINHALGDARLRDVKPEFEEFAVDARRAPKRVLDAHLPNQRTQICINLRSACPWMLQNDQLMSERRVLGFQPALRLEWRGQGGQYETRQRDHGAPTLGDSF